MFMCQNHGPKHVSRSYFYASQISISGVVLVR